MAGGTALSTSCTARLCYDSDLVLTFEDILNGKAGPREAEAARAWSSGQIVAPSSATTSNIIVGSDASSDMRLGNKKRRRQDSSQISITASNNSNSAPSHKENPTKPSPHDSVKQEPSESAPHTTKHPFPQHELSKPSTSSSSKPSPVIKPDMPPPPPRTTPQAPQTSVPDSTNSRMYQVPEGGRARVNAWLPVPDCFTVLTKVDSAGKIRKTFLTPDNRRWYTLKEAKAYWESQGGDMTCTSQPGDEYPPSQSPASTPTLPPIHTKNPNTPSSISTPEAAGPAGTGTGTGTPKSSGGAGGTGGVSSGGGPFRRGIPRLPVPDQFRVESKVDAGGKERKKFFTPDGKRWVTLREAKEYWEGLGHTLTYENSTNMGLPVPSSSPSTGNTPTLGHQGSGSLASGDMDDDDEAGSGRGDESGNAGGKRKATALEGGEKWVPPGWKAERRVRTKGARIGAIDWYYIAPDGTVYRSYVQAQSNFQNIAPTPVEEVEEVGPALRALARLETLQPNSQLEVYVERIRGIERGGEGPGV